MKQVYVIRHANWDLQNDKLTAETSQKCLEFKKRLGDFDLVFSSNFGRAIETARLLSGKEPVIDNRAGILKMSDETAKKITALRQNHPLGVVGVLFSFSENIEALQNVGSGLCSLIKEVFLKLPKNGKALVVSHDGTMVSCEKILKNESFASVDKTYGGLEGFLVDEQMKINSWVTKL